MKVSFTLIFYHSSHCNFLKICIAGILLKCKIPYNTLNAYPISYNVNEFSIFSEVRSLDENQIRVKQLMKVVKKSLLMRMLMPRIHYDKNRQGIVLCV